jgi:hypothetical protein
MSLEIEEGSRPIAGAGQRVVLLSVLEQLRIDPGVPQVCTRAPTLTPMAHAGSLRCPPFTTLIPLGAEERWHLLVHQLVDTMLHCLSQQVDFRIFIFA